MKLIEEIMLAYNSKEIWAYYDKISNIKFEEVIKDPEHFIIQYLHLGEKIPSELLNNIYFVLDKYRMYHTVSLFFLGITIYKNCEELRRSIDLYLSRVSKRILGESKINDIIWDPSGFSYYWFLICFFHDFAYQIVQDLDIVKENNLLLFNTNEKNSIEEKVSELLGTIPFNKGIVPIRMKKICPLYNKYRIRYRSSDEEEEIDHGIFAGSYFYYDRARQLKNMLLKEDNIKKYSEEEVLDLDKNLIWSTYILKNIHADVAWIIACHNIWFRKKKDKKDNEDYKDEGLGDLIIRKPIYTFKSFPFFFLLELVDTIDIYKYMCADDKCDKKNSQQLEKQFRKMCDATQLSYTKDSISIRFSNKMISERYKEKIEKEKYWIPINVNFDNNEVIIKFI